MVLPMSVTPASRRQPVRDGIRFFGSFVRNPKSVGAVLPSSRRLAEMLVGDVDQLAPGDVVVEYGPGTGPVTKVIAERLPPGVRYLGIELNELFHAQLTARFPQLTFHHGSAGEVARLLREHGLARPKRIVSGLPFASLPAQVQDEVIDGTAEALTDDGEFRTFQYVHAYGLGAAKRFRSIMGSRFAGFERLGPVVRNVPPAYVLVYRR